MIPIKSFGLVSPDIVANATSPLVPRLRQHARAPLPNVNLFVLRGERRRSCMTPVKPLIRTIGLVIVMLMTLSSIAAAETVITLATSRNPNFAEGVKATLNLFYKQNPGIRVEVISDYGRDKFKTAVAAGAAPDIYADGAQYIISHAINGLVKPLDDYISTSKINMGNFVPPNVDLARWRGKTYAIPWTSDINFALYKNTELLRQGGYDTTKPINTVKQLDDISRRMLRVNPNGQIAVAPFMPWKAIEPANGFLTMTLAFGGSFWDAKTEAFTTAAPRNVATLEWFVDYARQYHQLNAWPQTSASLGSMIGQNKIVFGLVYSAQALDLKNKYPNLSFELGPIPHVEGQGYENPVWVAGAELMIPVGSPHPAEAFKLMSFLASDPEGNTLFAKTANVFPSNLRSPYHRELMNDPISQVYYQQATAARFSRPPVPNQDFWTATLNKAVNDAIALTVPPNQALQEANRLISANYEDVLKQVGK